MGIRYEDSERFRDAERTKPWWLARLITCLSVAALASIAPRPCLAHPFDVVIVDVSIDGGSGTGKVSFGKSGDSQDGSSQNGSMAKGEIVRPTVPELVGEISFGAAAAACSVSVSQDVPEDRSETTFALSCPEGFAGDEVRITRNAERLATLPPEVTTMYFISVNGERYTTVLGRDDAQKVIPLTHRGVFFDLLGLGIRHIGASWSEWRTDSGVALPEGIDHILFVLTLVLASPSLLSLLKTVTGFTLGHSVSLACVTMSGAALSAEVIEPAIAASIALMALDSMRQVPWRRAWIPAALFGLLHGCGFASALLERNLHGRMLLEGLLGFNLGVEAGQLVFVGIFVTLIGATAWMVGSRRIATLVTAWGVFIVSTWWFVTRVGIV
jgi:hypothetical protein